MQEVGRTRDKRRKPQREAEWFPAYQVFSQPPKCLHQANYVNMATIFHFFYKITNERGTKTVFTCTRVKWFYGQSEGVYYLNYFIKPDDLVIPTKVAPHFL